MHVRWTVPHSLEYSAFNWLYQYIPMSNFSFDKEDREVEDSDEEEEMNGNNDSDEEG